MSSLIPLTIYIFISLRKNKDPPGKFKCSAPEWFSSPEGITPNSGLTGPNNSIYIYIYIYIYTYVQKGTPNDEYENFVEAHLEAVSKRIPTKTRTKYRVPWETLAVREKRALVKTAFKSYRKNPTNTNARKLEKAQYQLAGIYLKEQTEYIHR